MTLFCFFNDSVILLMHDLVFKLHAFIAVDLRQKHIDPPWAVAIRVTLKLTLLNVIA